MIPFIKKNNEKITLLIGLIVAGILFFIGGAGATGVKNPTGNENKKEELKAEMKAFNEAVAEFEVVINTEEEVIYEIQHKTQFYDSNFTLIYETTQCIDSEGMDEETAQLFKKAEFLIEQNGVSIYLTP